ncbi:PREDICTED: 39S ribosomal protein L13, mitochondrial isoform X2 [Haliaeetus leucocephalus]|uniref:39S ribosomal protein L13, mitochondrial isoform X2 n=1 Tax=Haliaeetus leucocephalus TaxID=52644 RepID=UPI00053CEDDE|nr:PREDICTED: 39S ribosomal protein L13, mitochondrial isoform X2 [Haliaeetus leucocephalus]
MASYTKAAQQWATFARAWYLLDAKMQPPGKIAAATVIRLEGRHKPIYHALSDCGDHVVIINTRHIAFSGNKWEQKVYSSHTGYPGGFKQVTATQLHLKDPTAIVKLTVYRMLPKNLQRRTMMQRLHLFPEDVIPEDIQKNLLQEIPQPRAVPKRLDEYTPEEIAAFPKVWTPGPVCYREEDRCILQCLEFLGCWKSNGSVPAELTAGILQSSKDSMNFRGDTVC